MLASCGADGGACAQLLQDALATITAAQGLSPEVLANLLGSLATVAVSVASTNPGLSTELGQVVNDIAASAAPGQRESLERVASAVSQGGADDVDLTGVAGSQSG